MLVLAQYLSPPLSEMFTSNSFYSWKFTSLNSLLQMLSFTVFILLSQLWLNGWKIKARRNRNKDVLGQTVDRQWIDSKYAPCFWELKWTTARAVLTENEEQPAAERCLLWFHQFRYDASHWNSNKNLLSFKGTWRTLHGNSDYLWSTLVHCKGMYLGYVKLVSSNQINDAQANLYTDDSC